MDDFEAWVDTTNYMEYPQFAVEAMRSAWTASRQAQTNAQQPHGEICPHLIKNDFGHNQCGKHRHA